MHIILDARTATQHFPGIGRYVTSLAHDLAPHLRAAERLTLIYDPAAPVALSPSEQTQVVPFAVSPFSLAQQWLLPRLLRQLRADVYHSPYILMPYAPTVATVVTIHDLIPLLLPDQSTARARLLFRWAMTLALRAASQVIAVSFSTRRDLLTHFRIPANRVAVVEEAVNPAFRPQPVEATAEICACYGLPKRFVLYLGSNKPHKNLVRLMEAWQMVNRTSHIANCHLVIAGAWDARYPEARQRAEALGLTDSVHWLGPVPEADLPALYAAAMAFVFPSLYEGFGLPVLEAMACGTPVICSNTSSLPEVVGASQTFAVVPTSGWPEASKVSQAAALLIDPLDTGALADAIRRVLLDPDLRVALQETGLARASEFTWTQTAAQTLAIYRKALAL